MINYGLAIICVFMMSIGQILFKVSAIKLAEANSIYDAGFLFASAASIIVYGLTSIAWILILKTADVGQVYPLAALAFVLVPIASYVVFGETFNISYFIGVLFIVLGVVLTQKFG